MKAIHYINQFFGQVGGEDAADCKPIFHDKLIGCSMMLNGMMPHVEVTNTMVVGDNYARRYESPLRIRRAAAAGDFFLAMNHTRDRLIAWRPDRPGGPVGNVIIPHLTGGNVQDICLIPA